MNRSTRWSDLGLTFFLSITIISFVFIMGLGGCASTPKAELGANPNPTEELAYLDSAIQTGYSHHYEVLDTKDFAKALKYDEAAKKDLASGKSSETVLDSIAYGKAYIQKAKTLADPREATVTDILKAREAALGAGIRGTPLEAKLEKVDDKLK